MKSAGGPPIQLIELAKSAAVTITRYDCAQTQAERFAGSFRAVWDGLPAIVRFVLHRHWTTGSRRLSVVLTEVPPPWGRYQGFASSSRDGADIYCWSGVLARIPEAHLRTEIAHELGHMTFIALGEPGHARVGYKKAEWLIIELLAAWGYDQAASDEWKARHLDLGESGPRLRDCPTPEEEYAPQRESDREMLARMAPAIRAYREEQRRYFAVAARMCSPAIDRIARTDSEVFGRILRGEEPEPEKQTPSPMGMEKT